MADTEPTLAARMQAVYVDHYAAWGPSGERMAVHVAEDDLDDWITDARALHKDLAAHAAVLAAVDEYAAAHLAYETMPPRPNTAVSAPEQRAGGGVAAEKGDTMPTFRKKPVLIEAYQMTKANRLNSPQWPAWLIDAWNKRAGEVGALFPAERDLFINTLEGTHRVDEGDWIIQGVKKELYPCKADIFAMTYDAE